MNRALFLVSVVTSLLAASCGSEDRPNGLPATVDSGLPLFESGVDSDATDTGTPADGAIEDTGAPADSALVDSALVDSGTPPGDAIFSDIMSTKDTEVDAIFLEAGGGDTSPDTELPDAFTLFDTAVGDVGDAR